MRTENRLGGRVSLFSTHAAHTHTQKGGCVCGIAVGPPPGPIAEAFGSNGLTPLARPSRQQTATLHSRWAGFHFFHAAVCGAWKMHVYDAVIRLMNLLRGSCVQHTSEKKTALINSSSVQCRRVWSTYIYIQRTETRTAECGVIHQTAETAAPVRNAQHCET